MMAWAKAKYLSVLLAMVLILAVGACRSGPEMKPENVTLNVRDCKNVTINFNNGQFVFSGTAQDILNGADASKALTPEAKQKVKDTLKDCPK